MTDLITIDIIEQSIIDATKILPIVWPLKSSIAINPLWDLRDKPFELALEHMRRYLPVKGYLSRNEYLELFQKGEISRIALKKALLENTTLSDDINEHILLNATVKCQELNDSLQIEQNGSFPAYIREEILHFISRYFDEEQAKLSNNNAFSLWNTWKKTVQFDSKWKKVFNRLPSEPLLALQNLLSKMEVISQDLTEFFTAIFSQLLGWHGFIKWLESRKMNPLIRQKATLVEIALIWCSYLYVEEIKPIGYMHSSNNKLTEREITQEKLLYIWQRAYELTFEQSLLKKIKNNQPLKKPPLAQFVFCIDVRSEAIRRHLESINCYETFGYAGFFGSIFSLKQSSVKTCTLQAPALVEPNITVHEQSKNSMFAEFSLLFNKVLNQSKDQNFSAFAFFEIIGIWMLFSLLQKTFVPKFSTITDQSKSIYTNPFLSPQNINNTVNSMFTFLKTIGLTEQLAPTVIICGHQAKTTNNPFQASFDCGACGGNSGAINAKMTCEILNHSEIRRQLSARGIKIPQNTNFISACHETTTDRLMMDEDEIRQHSHLREINSDIKKALEKLKIERLSNLPGHHDYDDRAFHYAELIPEWGLAKNAAMIIGPRTITRNVNLNSRVFLHSYEPDFDQDATILEGILTAPVIVAHWINSQYYFSATDPEIYGAGNKVIHNVVSKVGVMEGNQSDLKMGLPQQSLFFGNERVHEPLKLLVVIYAKPSQVNIVLKRQPQIKSLFEHGWINMHIINPEEFAYAQR